MMFYLLAVCVCLSVMFLVLVFASLLGWTLRGAVAARLGSCRPATAANVLFAARILPCFLALSLSLGLALPAFMKFEPHSTGEGLSAKLLLLAANGAMVLLVMALRGVRVLWATADTQRLWGAGREERRVTVGGSLVPLHYVDGTPALLAAIGFFRPRIFVAREVTGILTPDEMGAALAHEMAHVSFFDNLKQLLLKVTRPPRWLGGDEEDAAWVNISEVAADEAALAGGASAVDLAAALVKMAALNRECPAGSYVAASHLLSSGHGSSLEMRIARLEKALEGEPAGVQINSVRKSWRVLGAIMLPLAVYVAALGTLLPAIHEALEILVR